MRSCSKWLITGFMGSGKTTILRKYESSFNDLGFQTLDLDTHIEELSGESVAKIINKQGLENFRSLEQDSLNQLLKSSEPLVISLGGGALSKPVLQVISEASAKVIWLDTSFEVCLSRIRASGETRPLSKLSDAELRSLYKERLPIYKNADYILNSSNEDKLIEIISSDTIR